MQWAKVWLDEDTQNTLFLKGIREEYIEILNLICGEEISQGTFKDVKELCRRNSRGLEKGKTIWELGQRESRTTSRGVSQVELGNMLDKFHTNMLSLLAW